MKRVRISDVAEKAGVSTATVSYALSNSGWVLRETRERLPKIAKEMGFIRDDVTAQLRTGRSSRVGVILNTVVNPFFSELVASLELATYDHGYLHFWRRRRTNLSGSESCCIRWCRRVWPVSLSARFAKRCPTC